MNYITSTAANGGDVFITVYFKQGNRCGYGRREYAKTGFPLCIRRASVRSSTDRELATTKQQNSELKTIALYSPDDSYDMQFLNNYMKINVEPRIKRIAGVGKTEVLGSNYSMRIWLKPDVMAQYKLIPSRHYLCLAATKYRSCNRCVWRKPPQCVSIHNEIQGRYSTPEEFGQYRSPCITGR